MSEPIMFKGREVVAVKTDKAFFNKCCDCVGNTDGCDELPLCKNIVYQYARPAKRKVAKITVGNDWDIYGKEIYHFIVKLGVRKFMVNCKFGGNGYSSRKSAIRGARRFCNSIGYECEIVKDNK